VCHVSGAGSREEDRGEEAGAGVSDLDLDSFYLTEMKNLQFGMNLVYLVTNIAVLIKIWLNQQPHAISSILGGI